MTRETKAQRLERERLELEHASTYVQRLMDSMERATKFNYNLTVDAGRFQLKDRDDYSNSNSFSFSLDYNKDNENSLQKMTWALDTKEEYENEKELQRQVKINALSKLTNEERAVLGL